MSKAYCYLLINAEGLTYLGATETLSRRLKQHNSLTIKKSFTSGKGPWILHACQEFSSKKEAFDLEKHLKSNRSHKLSWIQAHLIK